ncbi:MAG: 50S ribosomal protein L24 [Acidobacteria bacterium]|nr:MAG: 50S ribosomal protein L24 [Acidobacteriota bacterium]
MKIRKGDKVRVVTGKDRGAEGHVMRALPRENKVIVEGVNMAKKHQRPTRTTMQGGVIDKDMPIHVSNVMILCSNCGPVRIGYQMTDVGKIRVCRKCGDEI